MGLLQKMMEMDGFWQKMIENNAFLTEMVENNGFLAENGGFLAEFLAPQKFSEGFPTLHKMMKTK